MKNPIFLLLLLGLMSSSCNAQQQYYSSEDNSSTNRSTPSPNSNAFVSEVLKEVNALRSTGCRCGSRKMPPTHQLSWNQQLTDAAKRHALDIASRQQLDHSGKDGSSVMDRVTNSGYSWSAVAENIAFGYWDIPSVIRGWTESAGHCRNMMNADYKEVGVYRQDNYWVMVLATKL